MQVPIIPGKDGFGLPAPALEAWSISAGTAADFITLQTSTFPGVMPSGQGDCLKC